MALVNFTPKYIRLMESRRSGTLIKNTDWNELFNLNILQGDYNSEYLYKLRNYLFGSADFDDGTVNKLAEYDATLESIRSTLNSKTDKSESADHITDVTYDQNTGRFTFTKEDGVVININTALSQIELNFSFDEDTQELLLVLPDETVQRIPVNELLHEYTFTDSASIAFNDINNSISAQVKARSITLNKLAPDLQNAINEVVATANVINTKIPEVNNAIELATTAAENAGDAVNELTAIVNPFKHPVVLAEHVNGAPAVEQTIGQDSITWLFKIPNGVHIGPTAPIGDEEVWIDTSAGELPDGLMLTAVYDTNNDGVVDNAAMLNSHSADYYATAQGLNDITELKFTTIPEGTWTAATPYGTDTVYTERYAIPLTGVSASMFADVVFDVSSAISGAFSPVCDCYDGGVYIWADTQITPVIKSIIVHK